MSAEDTAIILRFVDWEPTELCPGCSRITKEPRQEWSAFLADGNPDAAFCHQCLDSIDPQIHIALAVLNIGRTTTDSGYRNFEVPF